MASTSVPPAGARERYDIHTAVCRARRAGLVCATCCELAERAETAAAQIAEAA